MQIQQKVGNEDLNQIKKSKDFVIKSINVQVSVLRNQRGNHSNKASKMFSKFNNFSSLYCDK